MIVAAVDLGSNTTRLLVGRVEDGRVDELHRESRITRLGEGVDSRRRLLPLPIARVRNVLTDYRRTAESLGADRTLLVATSAVRDAENGEAFLGEIEWSYGFATQLLSGDEEAQLTQRGVGELGAATLLVDIGGGSTELVLDGFRTSLPLGSVRFTERHGEDVAASVRRRPASCCRSSSRGRGRRGGDDHEPRRARSRPRASTTASRVHGHVLTRDGARAQLERLAALPLEERRQVPALEPERAPVIVAGAAILVAILDAYGLDSIRVSERDLLDGAALAAAELPEPEEGAAPPGAYTCC